MNVKSGLSSPIFLFLYKKTDFLLFQLERDIDGEGLRIFSRLIFPLRVLSDVVIDVDVEDENDDKQVIRLFDREEVVLLIEVAATALLVARVSATIKFTK